MKILVFSDSHGDKDALLKVVALELPELILHLGDHDRDCGVVEWEFPEIPLRSVRGNCDRSSSNLDIDEFTLGGKRFFMTHGHLYGVKMGYTPILNSAACRGADVLLFGHTHVALYNVCEGISIVNPGSISMGRKTYAVLETGNGVVGCEIKQAVRA